MSEQEASEGSSAAAGKEGKVSVSVCFHCVTRPQMRLRFSSCSITNGDLLQKGPDFSTLCRLILKFLRVACNVMRIQSHRASSTLAPLCFSPLLSWTCRSLSWLPSVRDATPRCVRRCFQFEPTDRLVSVALFPSGWSREAPLSPPSEPAIPPCSTFDPLTRSPLAVVPAGAFIMRAIAARCEGAWTCCSLPVYLLV